MKTSVQKHAFAKIEKLLQGIVLLNGRPRDEVFCDEYHRQILAIIDQTDCLGHYGLKYLAFHMLDNISELRISAGKLGSPQLELLQQWPHFMQRYLRDDEESTYLVVEIFEFLQDSAWVYPLEEKDADWLLNLVLHPYDREILKQAVASRARARDEQTMDEGLAATSYFDASAMEAFSEQQAAELIELHAADPQETQNEPTAFFDMSEAGNEKIHCSTDKESDQQSAQAGVGQQEAVSSKVELTEDAFAKLFSSTGSESRTSIASDASQDECASAESDSAEEQGEDVFAGLFGSVAGSADEASELPAEDSITPDLQQMIVQSEPTEFFELDHVQHQITEHIEMSTQELRPLDVERFEHERDVDVMQNASESVPDDDESGETAMASLFDSIGGESGDSQYKDIDLLDSSIEPCDGRQAKIEEPDYSAAFDALNDSQSSAQNADAVSCEEVQVPEENQCVVADDSARELLGLIIQEVQELHQQFGQGTSEGVNGKLSSEDLQVYMEALERVGSACHMIGLSGMQGVCAHVIENLQQTATQPAEHPDYSIGALHAALDLWLRYLQATEDDSSYLQILDQLQEQEWPCPLDARMREKLQADFAGSSVRLEEDVTNHRQTEAHAEDVSLWIPEDVNAEVLDGMLQELPMQAGELSSAVLGLQTDDFKRQLEVAKRTAHTLKGAANTVGIKGIANLMHNMEDILEALFRGSIKPVDSLHKVLVDVTDTLEQMAEQLLGMGNELDDPLPVYQALLDWANYIDRHGIQDSSKGPGASTSAAERPVVRPAADVGTATKDTNNTSRLSAEVLDELLAFSGEQIISVTQMQDKVLSSHQVLRSLKSGNHQIQALADEFEHLVEIKNVAAKTGLLEQDGMFDPLEIDQFNELRTFGRRLMEACADNATIVDALMDQIRAIKSDCAAALQMQKETQEKLIQSRMVPVSSLLARMKRGVRQAANATGKTVQLKVQGEHTLVDAKVVGILAECLLHLIRNAVDHGIESVEQRHALGKPECGTITLQFARQDDQILVQCTDDGAGLNLSSIASRAKSSGLLSDDQEMSEDDAIALILQHGFTTRDEVTQVSGRGVGMDTVYAKILDLKGTLRVTSQQNEGLQVELSFPASLLSAQVLLVSSHDAVFAVATRGLEEIIPATSGVIRKQASGYMFRSDEHEQELHTLAELLETAVPTEISASSMVLVLRDMDEQLKLVSVDAIYKSTEVVMKPLSRYLPRIQGIIGSTVLGDGSLVPVLDLLGLMTRYEKVDHSLTQPRTRVPVAPRKQILVVEDSVSTRRALVEFAEDLGYEVAAAMDGVDAVSMIQQKRPDLIITDLEMPRMNGFELLSHLRANQETAGLPVIMLTSRSTDKHRLEAERLGVNEYLTKPFSDDLLQRAMNRLLEAQHERAANL